METLEGLLEAAKAGEIRGLAFVVKVKPGDNRCGLSGVYKRDLDKALKAALMLERHLEAQVSDFQHSMM